MLPTSAGNFGAVVNRGASWVPPPYDDWMTQSIGGTSKLVPYGLRQVDAVFRICAVGLGLEAADCRPYKRGGVGAMLIPMR